MTVIERLNSTVAQLAEMKLSRPELETLKSAMLKNLLASDNLSAQDSRNKLRADIITIKAVNQLLK